MDVYISIYISIYACTLSEANQTDNKYLCPSMIYTCTCISFSVSSPAIAPKFQCRQNPNAEVPKCDRRPKVEGRRPSPSVAIQNRPDSDGNPQNRIISLTPTLMVVIVGRWWVQQKQIVAAAERLPYQYKNSTRAQRHEERQNEECSMSMKQKFKTKLARTQIVFFHEWGSPSCRNSDPHPGALNTTHSPPHRIAAETHEKMPQEKRLVLDIRWPLADRCNAPKTTLIRPAAKGRSRVTERRLQIVRSVHDDSRPAMAEPRPQLPLEYRSQVCGS